MRSMVIFMALLVSGSAASAQHPLDPLSGEEITAAVSILRAAGRATAHQTRLPIITLHEPAKADVLAYTAGAPITRQAFIVGYEYESDRTFEAIVDLTGKRVLSWKTVADVQPPAMKDDSRLVTQIIRADPRWRAAMQKRSFDPDTVNGFAYPIGPFAPEGQRGRLAIARNDGVIAYVNLTAGKIVHFDDRGPPPNRAATQAFNPDSLPPPRAATHPLAVAQPGGPGFDLRGRTVRWQNWNFRFGMTPREGLVLYTVGYDDGGKTRPVLYRASLSELFVPYGDLGEGPFFLTAFDAGEAGLGSYGDVTMSPADCPANAVFAPAVMHDYYGKPIEIARGTCLYERDGGVLWRHGAEVRRSQELVLSSIVRVDNYDYGFNWVFRQDGSLELEVLLTGLMNARNIPDARSASAGYATAVAPHTEAMNHQHLFNFRLDMDVDGAASNSVVEMNVAAPATGAANPNGNAMLASETLLTREADARRHLNLASARKWKIINSETRNVVGVPTAYALVPGDNAVAYQGPQTVLRRRAGFVDAHLWVTPYQPAEMFAAGDYVYGSRGGDGLPRWTSANRNIANSDVVLWYTLGVTHIPRAEDWPIMPAHRTGFKLVPLGFFSKNPALDVPETTRPEVRSDATRN